MGLKEACQAVRDAERACQAHGSNASPEGVGALRNARRDLDAAHRELATALFQRIRASVARQGRQVADCEDIAADSSLRAFQSLASGQVGAGREDSFAESCGINGVRDAWRRQKREGVRVELNELAGTEESASPESMLVKEEERRIRRALLQAAMSCAAHAPENYRYALLGHYGMGLSIPELASEELYRRIADGHVDVADPEAVTRAWDDCEATVNAWLSRGRRWLRQRAARILEMADSERP